jgi:monovalent cation/hydrogen antiporter
LATLVGQGFTMGWVARRLGLQGASGREDVVQEGTAWVATADAGLQAIEELARQPGKSPHARSVLATMAGDYRQRRRLWQRRIESGTNDSAQRLDAEGRVELALMERQRRALLSLRDTGKIDDAISRHVERYLDLETLLFSYPALDVDDSPFEVTE